MRHGITEIRTDQLNRIKTAIRRASGPIRWTNARLAMEPRGESRDARFHNGTIAEFVTSGQLTQTWDDHGNVMVSYPL